MHKVTRSLATLAAIVWAVPSAAESDIALPAVPAAIVAEAPKLAPIAGQQSRPTQVDWQKPTDIGVIPGVNEIVVVAVGHANRIVTPFEKPVASSAAAIEHSISANVIYLAPADENPVTMYLTEAGDETTAISLTLVPKQVPPREIRLKLATENGQPMPNGKPAIAKAWEEANGYTDTIRNVLREISLEQMPQGYSMRSPDAMENLPRCRAPLGIEARFDDGQVLTGSNFAVYVGVVTNTASGQVELLETWCAGGDTAAVAYWPYPVLVPGQQTEIYVVQRLGEAKDSRSSTRRHALVR